MRSEFEDVRQPRSIPVRKPSRAEGPEGRKIPQIRVVRYIEIRSGTAGE
jgi:hypothetical protein